MTRTTRQEPGLSVDLSTLVDCFRYNDGFTVNRPRTIGIRARYNAD